MADKISLIVIISHYLLLTSLTNKYIFTGSVYALLCSLQLCYLLFIVTVDEFYLFLSELHLLLFFIKGTFLSQWTQGLVMVHILGES